MTQVVLLAIAVPCLAFAAYLLVIAGLYMQATSHRMKSIAQIRAGNPLENPEHERAERLSARADRLSFWTRP